MKATTPVAAPRPTVASVRAQIAQGDLAAARRSYDALSARVGSGAELLMTEGLLNEAQGDLEAALACFSAALATHPGSVHANAQSARLLMRLERPREAEAAAQAALGLDPANLNALIVLAAAYALTGRTEERLDVMYRLAICPSALDAGVWNAIGELALAGRWTEILRALDERGAKLAYRRVCAQRVEALIELGRQREALDCILAAHAQGQLQSREMVNWLVARRAFTVAATFIDQALGDEAGAAKARAEVVASARRACDATTLEASPFDFADAVRALAILLPDRGSLAKAVERSAAYLVRHARIQTAAGDYSSATDHLIRAGRLRPTDRAVLEMLADAAERAGRPDRHLDTLLRICRFHPDGKSVGAAVEGAISQARWDTVAELLSRAYPEIPEAPYQPRGVIDGLGPSLARRFEAFLADEDCEGALAMVGGLGRWIDRAGWPGGLVARLLAMSKRRLRSQRTSADALAAIRLCSLYLAVDPADADVGRVLGRIYIRYRRFAEAAEVLVGVVGVDPHVARDWADLAQAHHALDEAAKRDACMARALLIAPHIGFARPLDDLKLRMVGG